MSAESAAWFMPGRIEVLGKHTDYGGGRVLVCAVDRGVTAVAAPLSGQHAPGTIQARTAAFPEPVTLQVGAPPQLPAGHWALYVHTVMERLSANFGPLRPASVEISSDLPLASGMSSSSALLTAVALALADLNDLPSTELWRSQIPDRLALAGYAASIENGKSFGELAGTRSVGTSGGSLDHTGMLTSNEGMVSYAEFDPMRLLDRVALPEQWRFVVAVSGVLAEKTGAAKDAYNRGPAVLGAILERWNQHTGRADATLHGALRSLVDEDLQQPLRIDDERFEQLRRFAEPGYEQSRLDQFLWESAVLVPQAHAALRDGELEAFSDAVRTSQQLAQTHLGNQVPETLELVRLADELGAHATSAFGAGFGGSVWALVDAAEAEGFAEHWLERYRAGGDAPEAASVLVTRPGPAGDRLLDPTQE